MSDPFASQGGVRHAQQHQVQPKSAMRYPTPPLSPPVMLPSTSPSSIRPPAPHQPIHQTFTPPTSASKVGAAAARSTPPLQARLQRTSPAPTPSPEPDEFGAYTTPAPTASTSQSTSATRQRVQSSHGSSTMPLPLPGPVASTSATVTHAYAVNTASGSTTTTPPSAGALSRKRQSHNPSTLTQAPSPPKLEQLTDEYILHPSVHAWRVAHERRPLMAFGPYVLLQTLGEGEFGKVKLGVHTEFGVEVAIKLIRRASLEDEEMANKVEREIEVLKILKHPNIVRMFDVIDTDKYIGIVLDYAGGGELFDYILANEHLRDKEGSRLFAQLISGVDYLHRKGIVHRDLKLENLLLDKQRNIVITDFGFANCFDRTEDDLMATSCGSPCYAAPELVLSEGLYAGSAVDIWSCGIILFAMLAGFLPYDDDPDNPDGDNINLLYQYILSTELKYPEQVSELAASLMRMMLVPDPDNRCTIYDIVNHPWLASQRQLFDRTVEMNEWYFADLMYKKSQQAKRELQERKRVADEAKAYIRAIQRSRSTAPGMTMTAGMLDARRTQRHQSALPGAVTVPDHLANAGHRTPPLSTITRSTPPLPAGAASPSLAAAVSGRLAGVASAPLTPDASTGLASITAVEDEPLSRSVPIADAESSTRPPMSQNKNRHTIQVEYDADAAYERMKAEQDALRGSESTVDSGIPGTPLDLDAQVLSDVEMSESEMGHGPEGTVGSVDSRYTPDASRILASSEPGSSSAILSPETPRKGTAPLLDSPSTPRASRSDAREDVSITPKANLGTPKARRVSGKTPIRQEIRFPDTESAANASPSSRLTPAGLPAIPPPKRDRNRKGMSLDKFGLAKLLGQSGATSSVDVSRPPPSAGGATAAALQSQQRQAQPPAEAFRFPGEKAQKEVRRGSMRPSTAGAFGAVSDKEEKRSKRKTLQSIVGRTGSIREKRGSTALTPIAPAPAPLSTRDMNPITPVSAQSASATQGKTSPIVVRSTGIQPAQPANLGQSSPSIVTVDGLNQPQPNKNASSSAAKKVMDWFRRKSLARESISISPQQAENIRSDSASSFVRVEEPGSIRRTEPSGILKSAAALSSTSSVAVTAEGPVGKDEATQPVPDSATLPSSSSRLPEPSRQPLADASSGANTASASLPRVSPPRSMPVRAKSHDVQASLSIAAAATTTSLVPARAQAHPAPRSSTAPQRQEELKLRIHTGVVDQSALSSKAPTEIMAEVIKVLIGMGLEVKRENEYRLRCTRAKKGAAAAAPASRGLRGSLMGPAGLMGNSSSLKLDSRGLPMPQSPSASILSPSGIKGMLRRSSTAASVTLPRGQSEPQGLVSPAMSSIVGTPIVPAIEPLYGEHSVDGGDEVKMNVELCRMKNLPGLYLLNIKRLRGNVWSFKFIYQTVIERCDTLTH